jgi:hypothetical protein
MITERPRTHFLWVELQTGLDATIGSNCTGLQIGRSVVGGGWGALGPSRGTRFVGVCFDQSVTNFPIQGTGCVTGRAKETSGAGGPLSCS